MHYRIPIDEPLVAINEAFAVKLDKDPSHRSGDTGIHREPFTAPIRRGAEAAQLANDVPARLFLPFPDTRDELLATEIALCLALLGELVGDDDFRRDAGVIGAGLP